MVYFPDHAQTAKLRIPTSVLTNGQSGLPNTFLWLCKWASRQFNSSGQFRDPSHVLAPGETCFSLSQSAMFTKLLVFVQFHKKGSRYCFTAQYSKTLYASPLRAMFSACSQLCLQPAAFCQAPPPLSPCKGLIQ